MKDTITVEYGTKTILELRNFQEQWHLNLGPGFQRQSFWTITDRRMLIQSVLDGYQVPSIFLYRRERNGVPTYDVLDDKQRLRTIFMFSRVKPISRNAFEVKHHFPNDDGWDRWNWKYLKKDQRSGQVSNDSLASGWMQ